MRWGVMVGYEEGRVRYEGEEVKWRGGWYMRWGEVRVGGCERERSLLYHHQLL